MTAVRMPRALRGIWVMALLVLAVAARAADVPPTVNVEAAKVAIAEPATLVVWNRPIVTLHAQIDALTPQMRVQRIRSKIGDLPPDALTGAVKPVPATLGDLSGYWIYVSGHTVIGLLPEDVDPDSGQTLEQFAQTTARNLAAALQARADQQRAPLLIRGALLSLLVTALFALAVWGITWLRGYALRGWPQVSGGRALRVLGLNLRPYLRAIELSVIKLSALGAGLFAAYAWLTLLLGFFPYTQPWADGLADWLGSRLASLALDAVAALPGLFTVIVVFLVTRLVVQGVDRFFRSVEAGWLKVNWLEAETARATRRLAIFLIWIFALTVAYPYIPGSHSDAFRGITVLVGLMVSLGSAGFVNQVMSGLVIVYSRSLKTGEFVQFGETQGTISEIGVLATKMITPTRQEITIPNAALAGAPITNFSRLADPQNGSIIGTTVTIGYDTPWRQVHALLVLAAERTAGVRLEPKPRVLQRALGDFYVEYRLLISISDPKAQPMVLSELHARIQDAFNEFGVQIMSPNFRSQPAEKVWVPKSDWYAAPAEPPEGEPAAQETPAAPTAPRGAG